MNKKFIIRRAVCAALALVMIVACLPLSAFSASSDSPTFSSDAANSLMKNTVPAGYDKTTNLTVTMLTAHLRWWSKASCFI